MVKDLTVGKIWSKIRVFEESGSKFWDDCHKLGFLSAIYGKISDGWCMEMRVQYDQ